MALTCIEILRGGERGRPRPGYMVGEMRLSRRGQFEERTRESKMLQTVQQASEDTVKEYEVAQKN
jgi:hypothetical protein